MSRSAHLVKVLVQTVWVVIDSGTDQATEFTDTGVVVPAAEWPAFYERHCADFAAIQAETKNGDEPPPNRAARRAKPAKARPQGRPTPGP